MSPAIRIHSPVQRQPVRAGIECEELAATIWLVQGGIQSLSRLYDASLVPEGRRAEFFGFYSMMGKFAN